MIPARSPSLASAPTRHASPPEIPATSPSHTPALPTSSTQILATSPTSIAPLTSNLKPIYHDESTFYANADQSFHWSDGLSQVLKSSMIVSDIIDEVDGYLRFSGREARLYLEHQTDGYFNNDMFVKQVDMAVDIFESKYHDTIGLFIFDNAPSHCKKSDDSLNPDHMNVKNGGKQPQMRDTERNGKVQSMTMDDGQQKGMKQVLIERGVDTKGMNADKMRGELTVFADSLTIVEELVTGRGHMCLFLPPFHCELNPIERCWCQAKNTVDLTVMDMASKDCP